MAGFFGLFNYEKEGPGIAKNAPKKKNFIVFFETFFRNFWKFITVNLVYALISAPVLTNGLACAGITNITRNIARDKHSFGLSDFFETVKKNWKQALAAGVINTLVYAILAFDLYFFWFSSKGVMSSVGMGISLCIFFIFTVMNYYIWTLMITFKFTVKQIYKNSFKFVFINMKINLVCFLAILLVYAVNICLIFLFKSAFIMVLTLEILLYLLIFPSFKFLLVQFCVFPSIKKYIIDPYYLQHPEDDIEKRRDLGIEVEEEPKKIINEDGEEESENVFDD
ncbi:MAG: YesL family protein [Clostridia bacterium]|nr:YesL family protein [Clostridia bacterium]